MSHAAVDSEVLFWFLVALTLLLLVFIGAVAWAHPEAAGPPQPPMPMLPALPPPPWLAGWPPAAVAAGAAAPSARAGYVPRHAGALQPGLMVVRWPPVSGGPPWGPAPKPPGLAERDAMPGLAVAGQVPGTASASRAVQPGPGRLPHAGSRVHPAGMTSPDPGRPRSAQTAQVRPPPGDRVGAHRRGSCRGAHRAGKSSGRAGASAGRPGRHRAGVR